MSVLLSLVLTFLKYLLYVFNNQGLVAGRIFNAKFQIPLLSLILQGMGTRLKV